MIICTFAVASWGVVASLPVRLVICSSFTGVMTICATRYASSVRLNCDVLVPKNVEISWSVTETLDDTSRVRSFCTTMSRRSTSRMSAGVRDRLASSCVNASSGMFLRASAYAVSSSELGDVDLEIARLGQEEVLGDQVVQQGQLGRERFVFTQRLGALIGSLVGLVDVVAGNLVAVHHRPRVRGDRRGRRFGLARRRHQTGEHDGEKHEPARAGHGNAEVIGHTHIVSAGGLQASLTPYFRGAAAGSSDTSVSSRSG